MGFGFGVLGLGFRVSFFKGTRLPTKPPNPPKREDSAADTMSRKRQGQAALRRGASRSGAETKGFGVAGLRSQVSRISGPLGLRFFFFCLRFWGFGALEVFGFRV